MLWFEKEILRNERRIARIESSPDPTKLRCNKTFYECQRDLRVAQLSALRENKPLTYYAGLGFNPLLRALGFEVLDVGLITDRIVGETDLVSRSRDLLMSLGLPDRACDRTTYPIALATLGELPQPSCIVASNASCQLHLHHNLEIAKIFNVPYYTLDIPIEKNAAAIAYVADQLRDLIAWVMCNVPGITYDEERLFEWLDADRRWSENLHQVYLLRKKKPCAVAARDGFREETPASDYPESTREKMVNWAREYAEELSERAEQGKVPNEQLRFLWCTSGPHYHPELFTMMERAGVTIPSYHTCATHGWYMVDCAVCGHLTQFGRVDSPLEEVARLAVCGTWSGPTDFWVSDVLFAARDVAADGVVYFVPRGCPQTAPGQRLVVDRVRSELGIPVWAPEAAMIDAGGYDPMRMESMMSDFIDLCLAKKAERGAGMPLAPAAEA